MNTITLYHQGVPVMRQALSELEPGTRLTSGQFVLEVDRRGEPDAITRPEPPDLGIVGDSSAMRLVRDEITRLARFRAPVLITGETGTGKELAARALHACSPRSAEPFVALNCGALTHSLVDDVLFGHERGAFTGACDAHHGAFERAHGGTLFLDEIGELPLPQQAALLRVLDDGCVTRLGSDGEVAVQVRLVAATNRNLDRATRFESFRLDLFHRLASLRVEMPPLRERPEDLEGLARCFLRAMADDVGPRELDATALELLASHTWPGNARELRNLLYRAAAVSSQTVITAADLDLEPVPRKPNPHGFRLEKVPDGRVEQIVAEHGGNVTAAARALGVPRSTVRDRFRRILKARRKGKGRLQVA
ncbi:MAG: sigma-54-dependent Fis family transcriptional regulator [Deltaproteobacteria bacterium]|nr:sigma-54-dependent Fis family transcriptional regulator [Deltaproteobacteria bacterium]